MHYKPEELSISSIIYSEIMTLTSIKDNVFILKFYQEK